MTQPDIEKSWEDLGVYSKPTAEELRAGLAAGPRDLVVGSRARPIVVIRPDGTVQYGQPPDHAAAAFWEAVGRIRQDHEQQMLRWAQIDDLLTRVGEQDLLTERLRVEAQSAGLDDVARASRTLTADLAIRRLELLVHQMIELARGLVLGRRVDPRSSEP